MPPNDAAVTLAGDELAAAAVRAGCRVLSRSTYDDGARRWPIVEMECPDNTAAIRFLNEAAVLDAGSIEVRDLALKIRRAHPEPLAFAGAVQAFVKTSVRFLREVRETFQHTLFTIRRRAGDCDDHSRAVAALAMAGGVRAQVVGVPNGRGQLAHVAPVVFGGTRLVWAETTIDAHLGEHPRAAAVRLGVLRPDIWAERRIAGERDARDATTTKGSRR